MTEKQPTNIPAGLADAGASLWESIGGRFELRPDEEATLLGACRAADMIAALRAGWASLDFPMLTTGSMGQDVIHPIIGELRAQEAQKAALLARLKLPDESGADSGAGDNSTPARKAAAARWSRGA